MKTSQPLLECVPNFSEGKNEAIINAIKWAIQKIEGQHLLHIDASPAANRTVFTFAGMPEAILEAAFQAIKIAAEKIDMRVQKGAHPRIGSTDVCPLIPLANITMEAAIEYSNKLAKRVAEELGIPIFLYEHSATKEYRKALPQIRKGEYEGLKTKLELPEWQPDFGKDMAVNWKEVSKTGATIMGARDILVAFNISLNTKDEKVAAQVAKRLRSSNNGLLKALRAIGWYIDDFDCAQVSMNLLDYKTTSPLKVWETCKIVANQFGVKPIGCEVVGLIPEICVLEAGIFALQEKAENSNNKNEIVRAGIEYLGLDKVKPFNPEEKILEYALAKVGISL